LTPNNDEDTTNALQQQGLSTIARVGAQPQATTSPSTPTNHEDDLATERDIANANNDSGGEERNEGAGGNICPPFYTDLDKLACTSNNNNNNSSSSYWMSGNKQDACNSHALGSHGKHYAIDSDIDTSRRRYNSISNSNNIDSKENIHTSDTPQILNDINNTSDCRHLIPAQFSTSVKANKAEEDLANICHYLLSQRAPPDLSSDALTHFISRTHHFLVSGR